MADQTDVANSLVQLLAATVYPNGTSNPSATGAAVKLYAGWPDAATLNKDFTATPRVTHVTVFPSATAKSTTRHFAEWVPLVAPAPTVTMVVLNQTITLGGTVALPQAVALIVDGLDYVYGLQAGDTLATIAAALAALVSVDQPATAAGPVVTIPGAHRIVARAVANGISAKEVSREERVFVVSVWASCYEDREPLAAVLEPVLADLVRLAMPDGTAATCRFVGSEQVDTEQKQGIYRRDIRIAIDYGLILTRSDAAVVIVQTRRSALINGISTDLRVTNQ